MVNKYDIDGDNLEKELRIRGLNKAKASNKLGFCNSYFSTVISQGFITQRTAKMLEDMLNIKKESYIKQNLVEEPPENDADDLDYHKLYRVIYGAVYQAMKRALSE